MKLFLMSQYSFVLMLIVFLVSIGNTSLALSKSAGYNPNYSIYSADIETEFEEIIIKDNFEAINRPIYQLNKGLDTVIFRPVALTYRAVTPIFIKDRATDFLHNLSEPVYFLNFVLQGEGEKAGDTLGRFLINTTLGLGGIFDIAQESGLKKRTSDFGLTLGEWGVETGQYLVLPILGPSSTRDLPGRIVDIAIDPLTYTTPRAFGISRWGASFITKREALLDFTHDIKRATLDEYSSIRSIYFQKREVKK